MSLYFIKLLNTINFLDKPVKIIGQKGWNVGIVSNIRLGHDFNIVVTVNKRTFSIDKIVELTGDDLKKYNLNNKINSK